jgi:hypothetical protein
MALAPCVAYIVLRGSTIEPPGPGANGAGPEDRRSTMTAKQAIDAMGLRHTHNESIIDRECGSLDVWHNYEVAGSHGETYRVRVRMAGDDAQEGTCTCQGFRFRGTCKHIAAAYNDLFEMLIAEGSV